MGCGSSKGVAPAPVAASSGAAPEADVAHTPAAPAEAPASASPPAAPSSLAAEEAGSPEAQSKLLTPQVQGHGQDHAKQDSRLQDMSLPGRIDSVTAPTGAGPAPVAAAAGAQQLAAGAAAAPGLLSRQPDWLAQVGQLPGAPQGGAQSSGGAAAASQASTHSTPAGGSAQGLAGPPSKGSSLPPLVNRAGGPLSGGLPPIMHAGGPSKLPSLATHQQQEQPEQGTGPVLSAAATTEQRASLSGMPLDAAAVQPAQELEAGGGGDTAPCIQQGGSLAARDSPCSSRSGASPPPAASLPSAVPGAEVAASQAHGADPWSMLSSQYAASSPSPDNSMAGSSTHVAKPPGAMALPSAGAGALGALPPLQQHRSGLVAPAAAAAGGGSVPSGHNELVLEDSDAEDVDADRQLQPQPEGGPRASVDRAVRSGQELSQYSSSIAVAAAPAGHAGAVRASSDSSGGSPDARLAVEASDAHSAGPPAASGPKAGAWGVGGFAGAGTLMLGSKQPVAAGAAPGPAAHDDVFGDVDEDEGAGAAGAHGKSGAAPAAAAAAAEGSAGGLAASHSHVRAQQQPEEEVLGLEEIEDDVDAMIESELAAASRDGLRANLAAKLAGLDALAGEDSDSGAGAAGEGGRDSPSVFALMNKQGSWRAA